MATHSIILAWEIPRTEEPARLQPTGSQRAGHNLATKQQNNEKWNYLKKEKKDKQNQRTNQEKMVTT